MQLSLLKLISFKKKKKKKRDRKTNKQTKNTTNERFLFYVDYDVLLFESKLSESIVVVTGMEGMASVRRNVDSLNSTFCR